MNRLGPYAFSIGAALLLLAGCGGSSLPAGTPGVTADRSDLRYHKTFHYTGAKQSFKVPSGVTHVTITAYGASGAPGGSYFEGFAASGGPGGMVTATIPVTPGELLAIFVGGSGLLGGFNGGGGGTSQYCLDHHKYCYAVGAGASDVRQGGDQLANRVVVAAGGGGGGTDGYYCSGKSNCYQLNGGAGGSGGGREGVSGRGGDLDNTRGGSGGSGGTQSTGGKGGAGGGRSCGGFEGRLGRGGIGGFVRDRCGGAGGGGGGGYYGAGGGGGGKGHLGSGDFGPGGGGGGGSSFAESGASHVKMTDGANKKANGSIVILW
ncbi:MAG TPA: hypothetical protein VKR56_10420 [Candidatus Cybelea sp.]|nr:hypothetical protein [Candidatus Cybelea sp.]